MCTEAWNSVSPKFVTESDDAMRAIVGKLETIYPDPRTSTGLMLWRVTNSWQRAIRAALVSFDLTHVQFVLLAALAAANRTDPPTQRDLANEAVTDPMMTSQVLRTLEQKGLIERFSHPRDKRAKILVATQKGLELVNRANAAVEEVDRQYFLPLGDTQPQFNSSLNALNESARHR